MIRLIRSRLLWAAVVLAAIVALHPLILRVCAGVLIVDQRHGAVDGIVIVAGDGRFDAAATWVRRDRERRILLIEQQPERLVELGILPSQEALAQRELAKRAVSDDRIELIPGAARNLPESLQVLAAWLDRHPDTRVAILHERFDSRDLRLVIDGTLRRESARRIDIWALPNRHYDERNWWLSRRGVSKLILGSIALAYTWCQGGPGDAPAMLNVAQFEALVNRCVGESVRRCVGESVRR